ncbi:hypothetical protein CF326_g58 [Tilletia indica]|nr:hypothetical protein CF326_g58 [Tilletia indica]
MQGPEIRFLEAQASPPSDSTSDAALSDLAFRRPGSPFSGSETSSSKLRQKVPTFASIFNMPSAPRIPPLGATSHSNKRIVSQPEVRFKQETTFTSTKRTHGSFDDSRYITSLNDPRLTQVLEYAPRCETELHPGIILHDPFNRPLSPSNNGHSNSHHRSNSPGSSMLCATPSPFLMPSPCQAPPGAISLTRPETDTPTSFESHFSNFTAAIATPAASSPGATDAQRASPGRWFSTLGHAGSRCFAVELQAASGGLLSPHDAYQLMLQRRPGLQTTGPSRPQSARPASTDPDDVRPSSRLGHKRKTSLQDNPTSAVRPKHSNLPTSAGEEMNGPLSSVKQNRPWGISPQWEFKRGFFDQPSGSRTPGTTPMAVDHRMGPPPGMPAWVPLPISDAFRPAQLQRNGSITPGRSELSSSSSAAESAEPGDSTIRAPPQVPNLHLDCDVSPGHDDGHSGQNSGDDSPAIQALHTVLETVQTLPRSQSVSRSAKTTGTRYEHEGATNSMQHFRSVTDDDLPSALKSAPAQTGAGTITSRSSFRMAKSASTNSSLKFFMGCPQLRSLIDSPPSRSSTPHRSVEVSETAILDSEVSSAGKVDYEHSATETSSAMETQDDLNPNFNVQFEIARRCAGSIAEPQLTVSEIDMKEVTPAENSTSQTWQPACRPPLKIVRPKPLRSSPSPSSHLPPLPLPSPLLTPPCPDHTAASSSSQKPFLKVEEVDRARSPSLKAKRSLVERRRLSSGNPLQLPTLTFGDDTARPRKSPGTTPLTGIRLTQVVNRQSPKGSKLKSPRGPAIKPSGNRAHTSTTGAIPHPQRLNLKRSPPIAISPARPRSTNSTLGDRPSSSRILEEGNRYGTLSALGAEGRNGRQQNLRTGTDGRSQGRGTTSTSQGTRINRGPVGGPQTKTTMKFHATQQRERKQTGSDDTDDTPKAGQTLLTRARSPACYNPNSKQVGTSRETTGTRLSSFSPEGPSRQAKGKAKMSNSVMGHRLVATPPIQALPNQIEETGPSAHRGRARPHHQLP